GPRAPAGAGIARGGGGWMGRALQGGGRRRGAVGILGALFRGLRIAIALAARLALVGPVRTIGPVGTRHRPALPVDLDLDPAEPPAGLSRAGRVGALLVHEGELPDLLERRAPSPHHRLVPGVQHVHAPARAPGGRALAADG